MLEKLRKKDTNEGTRAQQRDLNCTEMRKH